MATDLIFLILLESAIPVTLLWHFPLISNLSFLMLSSFLYQHTLSFSFYFPDGYLSILLAEFPLVFLPGLIMGERKFMVLSYWNSLDWECGKCLAPYMTLLRDGRICKKPGLAESPQDTEIVLLKGTGTLAPSSPFSSLLAGHEMSGFTPPCTPSMMCYLITNSKVTRLVDQGLKPVKFWTRINHLPL